jgi:Flp pilus assembly protein TadB
VPLGGFLVSASIAERLLEIIHTESGKFLVGAVLLAVGFLGILLFVKLLNFDDSVIVLSAVWGAGLIS